MNLKKEYGWLILILLLGVLIRLCLFPQETFIDSDGASYARLGKNLVEKGSYHFMENTNVGWSYKPGFPLLIGIINLWVKDLSTAGKLVSFLASLLTIFVFYGIGKKLDGKEAGLFCAFAFAVYPIIMYSTVGVVSEPTFWLFFFLAIYTFMVAVKKNTYFHYFLYGFLVGYAYLVRQDGLLLLVLPILYFGRELIKKRDCLLKIAVSFLIFGLVITPYTLFLMKDKGNLNSGTFQSNVNQVILTGKNTPEYLMGLNSEKTQVRIYDYAREGQDTVMDYVLQNPFKFIKKYISNLILQVKGLAFLVLPILFPLFLSLFQRRLFKDRLRVVFLLFPPIAIILVYSYFFFSTGFRYLQTPILLLVLISSYGYTQAVSILSRLLNFYQIRSHWASALKKGIKPFFLILLMLSSLSYIIYFSATERFNAPEYVQAGTFLKSISPGYEAINIMASGSWIPFYGDAKMTSLPYANYTDILEFGKLYHVDYIVVDERSLKNWQVYDQLMNMDKYTGQVELVYKENKGKLVKIFKVKK